MCEGECRCKYNLYEKTSDFRDVGGGWCCHRPEFLQRDMSTLSALRGPLGETSESIWGSLTSHVTREEN